jgi:hypothetical protein
MSMALKLAALADAGKPVRVGLIGKFGAMFLSQAPRTRGCTSLGSPTSTSIASANSPKGSGGLKSAPRPNHWRTRCVAAARSSPRTPTLSLLGMAST